MQAGLHEDPQEHMAESILKQRHTAQVQAKRGDADSVPATQSKRSPTQQVAQRGGGGSAACSVVLGFAFLAVIFVLSLTSRAMQPARPGPRITRRSYAVSLSKLRDVHEEWSGYTGDLVALGEEGERLAETFQRSDDKDAMTLSFLDESKAAVSTWQQRIVSLSAHHLYTALQVGLGWAWADARAAVLSNHYGCFVGSVDQFRALFTRAGVQTANSLLDIGSGPGATTHVLATALDIAPSSVTAVEVSSPLRTALSERGFATAADLAVLPQPYYGAVSLMNVLDRCDDPVSLLDAAVKRLAPDGVLVLAVVLPFCGKVMDGRIGAHRHSRPQRNPLPLPVAATCKQKDPSPSFEQSLAAFSASALRLSELEVAAWTRLPYLSGGTFGATHYVLDSALLVLRHRKEDA